MAAGTTLQWKMRIIDEPINAPSAGSDRSILRRIRSGESDAATDLYRRYARRIRALARKQIGGKLGTRVEPDEIVQSVFRTFFRRLTEGHYHVPAGEEIWGLFLVLALNKVRAAARFHHRDRRDIDKTQHLSDEAAEFPDRSDEDAEVLRQVVNELLASLPEAHRTVVSLRIDGYTVAEISQTTGLSKRTAERVLQRFRKRLAVEIEWDAEADV